MEKWEQQLKKQVNRSLPEAVDKHIERTLDELTIRDKKSSKTLFYIISVIAASLSITVGMTSLSPAFAEAMKSIPIIGSAFELVGGAGVKRGSQLGLSQQFNQQVQIGVHEITFTESLYDGSNINLGWVASADDKDPFEFVDNVIFAVDGKRLYNFSMDAPALKLENGTYAGTLRIDPKEQLSDKFILDIMSRDETTTYAKIPIELQGGFQSIPITKSGIWNEIEMNYDALVLYPTTTELSVRLKNTDDNIARILKFKVSDDQGHVLGSTGYHVSDFLKDSGEYKFFFEPFEILPKKVTIVPYISSAYTTVKVNGDWNGTPITIPQGKVGSIIMVDQKLEKNNLTATFEITGERIYDQVSEIWLYDHKGNQLPRVSPPVRIAGSNKYEITFANVKSSDSIQITTPVFNPTNYLRDLSVTLDLK
ncbi:hypothetical protein B2I21_20625 [Chryseobacterium mucoviscidosis]|nr:hypothetical protein B2I21_20625 [Chryseobacterium mucoviscidosis]